MSDHDCGPLDPCPVCEADKAAYAQGRADERDAACAEMRAALAALLPLAFPLDGGSDGCGTVGGWKADLLNDTRALLSRTDLGRGMVVVEIRLLETLREAALGEIMLSPKTLADLDALIKKGGG